MKIRFESRMEKMMLVLIIVFIVFSSIQWLATSGIRADIKEDRTEVKHLELENKALQLKITSVEKEKLLITQRTDSLEERENFYKIKYHSTNEKLKKILVTYANADRNTKNALFTDAVNN